MRRRGSLALALLLLLLGGCGTGSVSSHSTDARGVTSELSEAQDRESDPEDDPGQGPEETGNNPEDLYNDYSSFEIPEDYPGDYLPQFAALYALNPDVVGYLSIAGTPLHYPVVQTNDNDYYLRRDFMGNNNDLAVPCLDYRANIERPSDNLVIYGHNIRTGWMYGTRDDRIFGELMNYNLFQSGPDGALDYYRQHPVIDFASVYQERQYKIIAVFVTNAYADQGEVFPYSHFIDAGSESEMAEFLDAVLARSLIITGVDVRPDDKLLTLHTTTDEFSEARFVVVARGVRDGESGAVDVEAALINESPVMPEVLYPMLAEIRS